MFSDFPVNSSTRSFDSSRFPRRRLPEAPWYARQATTMALNILAYLTVQVDEVTKTSAGCDGANRVSTNVHRLYTELML